MKDSIEGFNPFSKAIETRRYPGDRPQNRELVDASAVTENISLGKRNLL
jgi:hypothetical protein